MKQMQRMQRNSLLRKAPRNLPLCPITSEFPSKPAREARKVNPYAGGADAQLNILLAKKK